MKYYIILFVFVLMIFLHVTRSQSPMKNHFLYKVQSKEYVNALESYHFNADGTSFQHQQDRGVTEEYKLYSVYTSTRAVYRSQATQPPTYIGLMAIENTLYKTQKENSLLAVNFYVLDLGGLLVRN